MRYVAIGFGLALGIGAGLAVGAEIAAVFGEPRWLPLAAGGGTGLVVFAALYFPLLRPIGDVVSDRLSATRQRMRATRTGTGLDEVPQQLGTGARLQLERCRLCGRPGKLVCEDCSESLRGDAKPKR
jgi:hypothetical protein